METANSMDILAQVLLQDGMGGAPLAPVGLPAQLAAPPWPSTQQQQMQMQIPMMTPAGPFAVQDPGDLKFDTLLELFQSDVAMPDEFDGILVAPEEWLLSQEQTEQHTQAQAQQEGPGQQATIPAAPAMDMDPDLRFHQQDLLLRPYTNEDLMQAIESVLPDPVLQGSDLSSSAQTGSSAFGGSPVVQHPTGYSSVATPTGPARVGTISESPCPSEASTLQAPDLSQALMSGTHDNLFSQPVGNLAALDIYNRPSGNQLVPLQSMDSLVRIDSASVAAVKDNFAATLPDHTEAFVHQMQTVFKPGDEPKELGDVMEQDLEKRLGMTVPKSNIVTAYCDKHGRKAMESAMEEIHQKGGRGALERLGMQGKSLLSKAANVLTLGRLKGVSKPASGKPGRVRPKEQLEVLEAQLAELQAKERQLRQDMRQRQTVVDTMDNLLNSKTATMDEMKAHNVTLDSELQESVMRNLGSSIEHLAIEQRAKESSLTSIFLGKDGQESAVVELFVQNWRHSIQRLSEILNECAKPGVDKDKATSSIELQVQNIMSMVVSMAGQTAGTAFVAWVQRIDSETRTKDPNYVVNKYEKIQKTVVLTNSQLKKLFALNSIFTSKTEEHVAAKNKIFHELDTAADPMHLSMYERMRDMQKREQQIHAIRLINISIMETRMLFHFTLFRKVLTPWQVGMAMILCYPMLPDPQFISCALLGVNNLNDVPWQKYKELMMAEAGCST